MSILSNLRKIIMIFIILTIYNIPTFANNTDYVEIFEKQYLNINRIDYYKSLNIFSFWVKSLNKEPQSKQYRVPNMFGEPVQFWYIMSNIQIDCNNNKSRTQTFAFYDLKNKLIDQSDNTTEWSNIIPDTYADGYYRLFCLVPYEENPLFNH